ncbi:hypothetical protein C8R44DRAFT_825490 [Mycena epipterygia]|nr:hypothetical protein C8R44DRAFT_825490 [Mycena epipterygia]
MRRACWLHTLRGYTMPISRTKGPRAQDARRIDGGGSPRPGRADPSTFLSRIHCTHERG